MHVGRSDAPRHSRPYSLPTSSVIPDRSLHLADMRAANRACILTALERYGPLSRVALARRIGLSRTTVGTIIGDLLREGRVREEGKAPASAPGGRRAILIRLCQS